MDDPSVFDRLARNLSGTERQELLERLRGAGEVPEPVSPADESDEPPVDYEDAYRRLGILQRIWVTIEAFFASRPKAQILADRRLRELAVRMKRRHGDLVDPRSALLLDGFADELVRLRAGVHAFTTVVHAAWHSRRATFLAFLVGVEAPDVQTRLLGETNPFTAAEPDVAEFALKQQMHSAVQYALDSIPQESRRAMTRTVRFLNGLSALTQFDFTGLLRSFDQPGGTRTAPFYVVREPLSRLAALVPEVKVSPADRVLEALVLFGADGGSEPEDEHAVARLASEVQRLSDHLRVVWESVSTLPLVDLCRLVRGDANWRPPAAPGGDPWLKDVQKFWWDRVELIVAQYQFHRRKSAMIESALPLAGGGPIEPIEWYPGPSGGGEGRHAASLALLRALLVATLDETTRVSLRTVFLEGEFYKDANRDEFAQACGDLEGLLKEIELFGARLQRSGDLGSALAAVDRESLPEDVRRENRNALVQQVDEAALSLVTRAVNAFRGIADVLYGILHGEVGGRYDSLANLGSLGGRSHAQLVRRLDRVMHRATECRKAIADLADLEQTMARRFRGVETIELTADLPFQ